MKPLVLLSFATQVTVIVSAYQVYKYTSVHASTSSNNCYNQVEELMPSISTLTTTLKPACRHFTSVILTALLSTNQQLLKA